MVERSHLVFSGLSDVRLILQGAPVGSGPLLLYPCQTGIRKWNEVFRYYVFGKPIVKDAWTGK